MANPWDVKLGSLDARKRVGCRSTHTPGVSFPGKKKILTKKDGITAKKRGRGMTKY